MIESKAYVPKKGDIIQIESEFIVKYVGNNAEAPCEMSEDTLQAGYSKHKKTLVGLSLERIKERDEELLRQFKIEFNELIYQKIKEVFAEVDSEKKVKA